MSEMINIEFRNDRPALISNNSAIQRGLDALDLDYGDDGKHEIWSDSQRFDDAELIAAVRAAISSDPRAVRLKPTPRWDCWLISWIAHGWRIELRVDFSSDGLMNIEPSLHRPSRS